MRIKFHRPNSAPLKNLYASAALSKSVSRSLNFILLGNLFGNLFGIICSSGTAAMVGLANELRAGDFAFGLINGIPQAAMLLQIPFAMLVSRTHQRKRYMLTFGLFSRMLWLLFGLIPALIPSQTAALRTLIALRILVVTFLAPKLKNDREGTPGQLVRALFCRGRHPQASFSRKK